jgi:hypothetical protein
MTKDIAINFYPKVFSTIKTYLLMEILCILMPFSSAQASNDSYLLRDRGFQSLERGDFGLADSLLSIAQKQNLLSASDLLRMIELKTTLSQWNEAGTYCCLVADKDPKLAFAAINQLIYFLNDQPLQPKKEALAKYADCALSNKSKDTLQIKKWLCQVYGGFALFQMQDSLLIQLDSKQYPSSPLLLEAAIQRFSQGFLSQAVVPARYVYDHSPDKTAQSLCAIMLFQWYQQSQKQDSASLWLTRSVIVNDKFKIQAISFLQETGFLSKADSLLSSLKPGFSADTLKIRQLLFTGTKKDAFFFAQKLDSKNNHDASCVWKIRTAVFCDLTKYLVDWIDTLSFSPPSFYADEILFYRYLLETLKPNPDISGQVFNELYALWLKDPIKTVAGFNLTWPQPIRELVLCEIIKSLFASHMQLNIKNLLSQISIDSAGAELKYYYGKLLLLQDNRVEASALLEKLILEYPQTVFAARSRLLLLNNR